MKIIFFGSGELALPSLRSLAADARFELIAVVTQPDKIAGRRKKLQPTPVKVFARTLHLPIFTTLTAAPIKKAEVGVVIDYGKIIPARIIQQLPFGILNIHPSLLPAYRGPAPIQQAILNDDTITGVSIIKIDSGVDTGPLLAQESILINSHDTAITLEKKLAELGADLLLTALPDYLSGRLQPYPQPDHNISYAPKLRRATGELLSCDSQRQIWNKFRALQPWPGVWFSHHGKRYKIIDLEQRNNKLIFNTIQPEGKNVMTLSEFKRGYPAVSFSDIL